jgi:multiple sugar transport system substrate-binding protein
MRWGLRRAKGRFWIVAASVGAAIALIVVAAASGTPAKVARANQVKLTVLTHWGDPPMLKAWKATFAAYERTHPDVDVTFQTVSFDQLLPKLTAARAAGQMPDVVHVYDLWLPDFVAGDALATPPAGVASDIKRNYGPSSVRAATVGGRVWGYPTELDAYLLLYNKKAFREAAIAKPPTTWKELEADAAKLTKRDASGKLVRSGFTVITGWDSGVVHPFLSLLWSNGGRFIDASGKHALVNDARGLETLNLYLAMIRQKSIDLKQNFLEDFLNGRSAMTIMANWWRAGLKTGFKDGFANVGVAPIPVGPHGRRSTPLQYNWAWVVSKSSENTAEAWKLVQWLNTPRGGFSPTGTFLTTELGVIPSRTPDQKSTARKFRSDPFMQTYIQWLGRARPEPVLVGGQEAKTILQQEIEAAWFNKKPAKRALDDAVRKIDKVLARG